MTLPDEVDLAGLARLQRQAQDLAARLGAGRDPTARYDGLDGSGAVRVTVDGQGSVQGLEVGRDWRAEVGVAGLGPAVVTAINDALRRQLEAWGEAVERASADEPDQRIPSHEQPRSDGAAHEWREPEPTPAPQRVDIQESLRELTYLAIDVTDQLAELSRSTVDTTEQVVEGRSADGRATAVMRGGHITEVTFDQRWLPAAAAASIAEHVRAALHAAAAAWAEQTAAPALTGRSFQELREITADPAALLRRLGLAR